MRTDPLFDPLRKEPRFRAIERALKFSTARELFPANTSTRAESMTAIDLPGTGHSRTAAGGQDRK